MAEGLRQEFEDHEWECVTCPLGALEKRNVIDMSWRSEGLVAAGKYRSLTIADMNSDGRPDVVGGTA